MSFPASFQEAAQKTLSLKKLLAGSFDEEFLSNTSPMAEEHVRVALSLLEQARAEFMLAHYHGLQGR